MLTTRDSNTRFNEGANYRGYTLPTQEPLHNNETRSLTGLPLANSMPAFSFSVIYFANAAFPAMYRHGTSPS